MPQARIQLQCAVPHTGSPEGVIGLAHALAATAHRVLVASYEQHRHFPVHLPQMALPLVKAYAVQHLAEQAHRGVRAAEGVGDVVVHVALVGGEPVHLRAVGGEQLVVAAEGQLRHQLAGGVLAVTAAMALASASPPVMAAWGCQPVPMMTAAFTVPG